jgi:hypothetical protein
MSLFKCAGCQAKTDENLFLREQVRRLQDTLTELADAGSAARLAQRRGESVPRPEEPAKPVFWRGADRIEERAK